MSNLKRNLLSFSTAAAILTAGAANASIIKIDESAFVSGSGLITFSEFDVGTTNPTYNPSDYGGGAGAPVVTFGGYFEGQTLGTSAQCPSGAALTGCVTGTPTDSLTLASGSPDTFIASDGDNPTSPILSGSPTFNGPVSILFDTDQAGVGLDGGFFDAIGGTAITAFDRAGNIIGTVANEEEGIEFLGLVTEGNVNTISGLQFSLVGSEPAGFGIDNLRFGSSTQIAPPSGAVPAPGILALFGLGLAGLGLIRRRRA